LQSKKNTTTIPDTQEPFSSRVVDAVLTIIGSRVVDAVLTIIGSRVCPIDAVLTIRIDRKLA